jgi:type IV secretion system protein TrbC
MKIQVQSKRSPNQMVRMLWALAVGEAGVLSFFKTSSQQRKEVFMLASFAALVVVMGFCPEVLGGNTGMPWESTLDKMSSSLTGPIAKAVGIAAVMLAMLGLAVGEAGGFFKKAMGILFGLSVAFNVNAFIMQLGYAGGALL